MKNVVRRLKNKFRRVVGNVINTLRYLGETDKDNRLVINAWMDMFGSGPKHRNLGDELNYYLIRELSGKHIYNLVNLYVKRVPNYCCIGSIVDSMPNKYSYLWGTGAMSKEREMRCKPLKVCAVRGPLTRQYLLEQGIDCPAVYGDPALMLPLIYKPARPKKYRVGIIPHICDFDNPLVQNLTQQLNGKDFIVVKMGGYADWHSIIDEINECEFIISSSLHGLILSDAYGVPNVWIEFSDKVVGKGFKFRDYFASVGRDSLVQPIRITPETRLEDILPFQKEWRPIEIDLGKLLDACPFEIQPKYRNIR